MVQTAVNVFQFATIVTIPTGIDIYHVHLIAPHLLTIQYTVENGHGVFILYYL